MARLRAAFPGHPLGNQIPFMSRAVLWVHARSPRVESYVQTPLKGRKASLYSKGSLAISRTTSSSESSLTTSLSPARSAELT